MQDSSMSETTALHTQQLSWKQRMYSKRAGFLATLALIHMPEISEKSTFQHTNSGGSRSSTTQT